LSDYTATNNITDVLCSLKNNNILKYCLYT